MELRILKSFYEGFGFEYSNAIAMITFTVNGDWFRVKPNRVNIIIEMIIIYNNLLIGRNVFQKISKSKSFFF